MESDQPILFGAAASSSVKPVSYGAPKDDCFIPASSNQSFWNPKDKTVCERLINKNALVSMNNEQRALTSSDDMISASRFKFQVKEHPLRWNKAESKPMF